MERTDVELSEAFWSGFRQVIRLALVVGLHYALQAKALDPFKANLRDWELVFGEILAWLAAILLIVVGENKIFSRPSIKILWMEHQRVIPGESLHLPSSGDGSQRTIDVEVEYVNSSSLVSALVYKMVGSASGASLRISIAPEGILRFTDQFHLANAKIYRSKCEVSLAAPPGGSGPITSFTLMIQAGRPAAQGAVAVSHDLVTGHPVSRVVLPRLLRRDATLKSFYVARRN